MFDVNNLLRPHLKDLVPYSSARDEYKGDEGVFLDANENPIGSITKENWNRYPDPYQIELKNPTLGVAPGQFGVIYQDTKLIGGGRITSKVLEEVYE